MDVFKQPNLGRIIQSLRQEKKLTQEELVEKCNVNVRTLQRIEAGEVTPREYTIKAILSALEYEMDSVEFTYRRKESIKRLHLAWIAGVVYFMMGIAEVAADFSRFEPDLPIYFSFLYTVVKILVAVSYSLFMLGFLSIGKTEKNSILQIASYLMAGSMIIICTYDCISIFTSFSFEEFMGIKGVEAVAFGGIDVLFGIALFKLGAKMGLPAKIAAVLEIAAGVCFVTFFLALPGLFFLLLATILEIVILYKYYDLLIAEK